MADLVLDGGKGPIQESPDGKWRYTFRTASTAPEGDPSQLPFSEGDFVVLSLQGAPPPLPTLCPIP